MVWKSPLCFLLLVILIACGTKSTVEQGLQVTDSITSVKPLSTSLDLDVVQYQVYESGDSSIVLPGTDLIGAPKDREEENIQRTSGVTRQGDELILILKSGQQKVLKNNLKNEESSVEYIFMRSLDAIGYWEILTFYYESFDYLLINQADGTETHLWNKPVVSPDNQYLLCGSTDLEAGYVPNGFQLWAINNDQLVLQWEKEITDWGAEKLLWTKDNFVWGEQTYRDAVTRELKTRLIKMRLFYSDAE